MLTDEELYNGVTKVKEILSSLMHNILFRPNHVDMYGRKQIAEIKSLITAVELHIEQKSNNGLLPQSHKTACYTPLAFKERRQMLRMSLREVAKAANVSAATISRAERGKELELSSAQKLDSYYAANGV